MIVFSDVRYANVEILHRTDSSQLLRCVDKERAHSVLMRVFFTSDDAEKSFILTEAAVLRKFQHPALASVYDVGTTTDEYPFFTFEDIGGTPLHSLPNGRFHTKEKFAALVLPVLSLLARIHEQYRTLLCVKPDTVRLTGNDKSHVKVALDQWRPSAGIPTTSVQEALPTPYAPPALSTGRLVDGRADLYAFGVTLYEVLTGASFSEIASVDSSGMVSHLLVKSLLENAPALGDDFANALGQWLSGLTEADRSMRFASVREAALFLASRGIFPEEAALELPETPAVYAAVHPIGVEAALGAVINSHFEETELPIVELSGEAGIGKTMFLHSLERGRIAVEHNSAYLQAKYLSALQKIFEPTTNDELNEHSIVLSTLSALIQAQKPSLLLIDDAEHLSNEERSAIREMLATQYAGNSVRVVAAHRTQLAVLGGKPQTLARFTSNQLTTMCGEVLGRCAFTSDVYKDLYAATKGHPLFAEELLRHLVRSRAIVRVKHIWTVQENFAAALKAATTLSALLSWHFKNCSEAAQRLLAMLAVATAPVPLYELADLLDLSTQSVMKTLLPLTFDGYVRFELAHASIAHEIYREAIEETLSSIIATFQQTKSHNTNTPPSLATNDGDDSATTEFSLLEAANAPISLKPSTAAPSVLVPPSASVPALSLTSGIFAGESAAVQRLRRQIELAAQYDIPALIEGQLGTGKEDVAMLIHTLSNRVASPLHVVVCTDFSFDELEHYLFGGVNNLIAQTQGGTLFLDDISSAPQSVQIKLARMAQAKLRTSSRLQAASTLGAGANDVRILLGCDRHGAGSPEQAMQEGRLYPELFFAASSMRVIAPALEERRDDIPAIAAYFLALTAQEFASAELTPLTDTLMKSLAERRWTGNVMELESVVRRMVLGSNEAEEALHTPSIIHNNSVPQSVDNSLLSINEAQKAHILRALELTGGNKTKAAEMLDIKRTTLIARMKKFGMMP
jgi:transcriptional regulator with AAA-type ATPase domain